MAWSDPSPQRGGRSMPRVVPKRHFEGLETLPLAAASVFGSRNQTTNGGGRTPLRTPPSDSLRRWWRQAGASAGKRRARVGADVSNCRRPLVRSVSIGCTSVALVVRARRRRAVDRRRRVTSDAGRVTAQTSPQRSQGAASRAGTSDAAKLATLRSTCPPESWRADRPVGRRPTADRRWPRATARAVLPINRRYVPRASAMRLSLIHI